MPIPSMVPRDYLEIPTLNPILLRVIGMFKVLATRRPWNPMSGTPMPIPISEITAYLDVKSNPEDWEWDFDLLLFMDSAWINEFVSNSKGKPKEKAPQEPAPPPRRRPSKRR